MSSVGKPPIAEAGSVGGPFSVVNGRGGGSGGGSSRSCAVSNVGRSPIVDWEVLVGLPV